MADEITDYQIVPQYDDADDVRWRPFHPVNWPAKDNKMDRDSGLLEGNYGHVNVPGALQKIEATWDRFRGKNKGAAGTDIEASTPLHGDQGGNGFMD